MKRKRKIIHIDEERCDGCCLCVPSCAEGAIEIVDGKARLIAEKYCDGLGACLGECPKGALTIIKKEAERFDEAAVEELFEPIKRAHSPLLAAGSLQSKKTQEPPVPGNMPCGCPSLHIQTFMVAPVSRSPVDKGSDKGGSALSHWPVQIYLVPPNAPFLKGADLLVAADCIPVAYRHFHRDFLQGKVVLLGCPKFDDVQAYIGKFAAIFQEADIHHVTVLVMEVPCCQGLPAMVEKGMQLVGKKVPMEKVIISPRGEILAQESIAA
jgi:NAD-dependent dihydropyrimidine dehydrogenase PreA subunit